MSKATQSHIQQQAHPILLMQKLKKQELTKQKKHLETQKLLEQTRRKQKV